MLYANTSDCKMLHAGHLYCLNFTGQQCGRKLDRARDEGGKRTVCLRGEKRRGRGKKEALMDEKMRVVEEEEEEEQKRTVDVI